MSGPVAGPRRIDSGDVEAVVDELTRGSIVVLPTDTVYGLCCSPTNQAAVDRLFALKGRGGDVPLAVLIGGADHAASLLGPTSVDLARLDDEDWPGGLTIVAGTAADAQLAVGVGTGGASPTLGVRRPSGGLIREIIARFGPVAATSANRHGEPALVDIEAIVEQLGAGLDAFVDGGIGGGMASSVVRLDDGGWTMLRTAAVDAAAVAALIGPPGDG